MGIDNVEIQQVAESILRANANNDMKGIVRGARDLQDCGLNVAFYFRYIAVNGDRIETMARLDTNTSRVLTVNGIRNPVLCEKYMAILNSKECLKRPFDYLKHLNDMSPEEYAWCNDTGVDIE